MPARGSLLLILSALLIVMPAPARAQQPPPEALAAVRLARARETRAYTERTFQHLGGGADCLSAAFVSYAHDERGLDMTEQWYQVSQVWADLAMAPTDEPMARCWAVRGFSFLDRLWDHSQPAGGFFARVDIRGERPLSPIKWTDDNALAGLVWVEAARRTADPAERELALGWARETAEYLMQGGVWDETFGGGFWWNTNLGDTIEGKPAQTNGLAAEFFLALYGMTGEPAYRTWALKTLAWLETKLYDRETRLYRWSVHYEDLNGRRGEVVAKRYFNYDQGIMIETHLLADRLLGGDKRYLERARTLGRRLDPVFWNKERGGYNLEAGVSKVFTVYSAWLSQSLLMLYARDPDPQWLARASANVDALNAILWDPANGGYFQSTYPCTDRRSAGCEAGAAWTVDPRKHTVDQAWMQRTQALLAATLLGRP